MDKKEILEQHYRENAHILIKRVTYRVGGNVYMAEDIVQEAYAKALRFLHHYNPEYDYGGWFNSVLNSVLRDTQRKERDNGVVMDDIPIDHEVEAYMAKDDLVKLIKREHKRNRAILTMFFFDGFKTRQIAKFLEINHQTVRTIIRRFGERFVQDTGTV